jgi:hypothetical protein
MRMERFPSKFFSVSLDRSKFLFPVDIISSSTSKPPLRTRAKSTAAPACANEQPHMQVARALSPESESQQQQLWIGNIDPRNAVLVDRTPRSTTCDGTITNTLVIYDAYYVEPPTDREQSTSPTTTLPRAFVRACMSDSELRGAARRRAARQSSLYLMTAISYA